MKKYVAFFASAILGTIALIFVSVASTWYLHSPKVPAELKKVNS